MKFLSAMLILLLSVSTVSAQTNTNVPEPTTHRAPSSADLDKPTPPVKVVIPAQADQTPYGGTGTPGSELDGPEIPDEIQDEPPTEPEEPPTFFGEPVSGKFVWILDRSGSMGAVDSGQSGIENEDGSIITNPNRIQIVKYECIKVLRQLREDDMFAIVSFGGNPDVSYYPEMVYATTGNVNSAVNTVTNMVASGGTPAYPALQRACQQYNEHELNKMYFLCDGSPNVGGGAPQILSDFPGWYQVQKDFGCEFVAVHIGDSGAAAQFMTSLANLVNGTYIHR